MAADWRAWLYQKLSSDPAITAEVGNRIYSTLDMGPDEKPFLVIRLGESLSEVHSREGGESTTAVIWVDDDPGTYVNIDRILKKIRTCLESGAMSGQQIQAIWQGDSQDLSDDARGTVVRNVTYRLVGRR